MLDCHSLLESHILTRVQVDSTEEFYPSSDPTKEAKIQMLDFCRGQTPLTGADKEKSHMERRIVVTIGIALLLPTAMAQNDYQYQYQYQNQNQGQNQNSGNQYQNQNQYQYQQQNSNQDNFDSSGYSNELINNAEAEDFTLGEAFEPIEPIDPPSYSNGSNQAVNDAGIFSSPSFIQNQATPNQAVEPPQSMNDDGNPPAIDHGTEQNNRDQYQQYFKENVSGRGEAVYRVTTDQAQVYKIPNGDSEPIDTLRRGDLVHLLTYGDEWTQIGAYAYIRSSDIQSLGIKTKGLPVTP